MVIFPVGDEGLEGTTSVPVKTERAASDCAHNCVIDEAPAFVAGTGQLAAWADLPPAMRQTLASLTPEMIAALQALFNGAPRQP
jgi:hypothetical protein